jgi:hypothetical protein
MPVGLLYEEQPAIVLLCVQVAFRHTAYTVLPLVESIVMLDTVSVLPALADQP